MTSWANMTKLYNYVKGFSRSSQFLLGETHIMHLRFKYKVAEILLNKGKYKEYQATYRKFC